MERKRNEHEKELLKWRIVRKATSEFTSRGIKDVRMSDIATSLGISKRTLYDLFTDKEELLVECIRVLQRLQGVYMARIYKHSANVIDIILHLFERTVEVFRHTNRQFFDDLNRYPNALALLEKQRNKEVANAGAFFREGVAQGIFRDDVNFSIMIHLVHDHFNILFQTHTYDAFPLTEVYESIIITYVRGISTERGVRLLDDFIGNYRRKQSAVR